MAVIRLIRRDPRPMIVVKTARKVGRAMFEKVLIVAFIGESASFKHTRYSETICRQ